MKKIFNFILVALAGISLFSGCEKDTVTLTGTTQRYRGAEKAYIDASNYACWTNGDAVKINGTTVTATVTNNTGYSSVRFSGVAKSDAGYYAIYPASACATTFTSGATITLPRELTYSSVNGNQVLQAPMAAKADGDNKMQFYNICLLLKVHFAAVNNILTKVYIKSADGTQLSGTGTVTFTGTNPTLGSVTGCDSVILDLGDGVNISGGADFYIPIPALASGKTLWIYAADKFGGRKKINVTSQQALGSGRIVRVDGPTMPANNNYTFKNYLQNNNSSSYINLGVAPDNTSKMEMTFKVTSPSNSQYYSGSSVAGKYIVFAISGASADNYLTNHFFNDYIASTDPSNPSNTILRTSGNKYRVTAEVKESAQNSGYYYLRSTFEELDASGNQLKIITKDSPEHAGGLIAANFAQGIPNIYVFGFNTTKLNPGMKLYSYKVWKNGSLICNFVPAIRNADSQSGVYDMVGNTFITPTGSFTAAND